MKDFLLTRDKLKRTIADMEALASYARLLADAAERGTDGEASSVLLRASAQHIDDTNKYALMALMAMDAPHAPEDQ